MQPQAPALVKGIGSLPTVTAVFLLLRFDRLPAYHASGFFYNRKFFPARVTDSGPVLLHLTAERTDRRIQKLQEP
jgi:hypothetical protein